MLLYIVRHGDPDYNNDSLTPRGILQAKSVGRRMFEANVNRIFSSPLGRAKMTAAPSCELLGLPCEIEEWAKEISEYILTSYPDGSTKSISSLPNTVFRAAGGIHLDYQHAFECAGISESCMHEAITFVEKEGNGFLERLGYKRENENYRILWPNEDKVALFCHAAFARAWISILLHIPLHIMWAGFSYTHTGVTILEFRNNENGITAPKCLCYSDMSHLHVSGPDTDYCYMHDKINL